MNRIDSLFAAAKNGHREMMTFFLDRGDNPNMQDSEGLTALMHATVNGNMNIVTLLLKRKENKMNINELEVDINIKTADGRTALTIASQKGYKTIEKLLKDAGAK
tara:strand:+ start:453 stop:767 length:315 start_codon:yes stop_codon:yes gene_type:complete